MSFSCKNYEIGFTVFPGNRKSGNFPRCQFGASAQNFQKFSKSVGIRENKSQITFINFKMRICWVFVKKCDKNTWKHIFTLFSCLFGKNVSGKFREIEMQNREISGNFPGNFPRWTLVRTLIKNPKRERLKPPKTCCLSNYSLF